MGVIHTPHKEAAEAPETAAPTARVSEQALKRAFGGCVVGLEGLLVVMNLRSVIGGQG